MRTIFLTFAIAAAGVACFWLLALPLPFLLGPMFACLLAALLGAPMRGVGLASPAMRTVLGVAAGASITPALLDRLDEFAISVAMVPLFVLTIGAIGYPYFRRVCGFDRTTAYYAAAPGGLQDMIYFGQEAGGDARALSLIHATRVLVIVSIMPFLMSSIWGASLDRPPGAPIAETAPKELLIMLGCALIGWLGGKRIGLFGAAILGPMALAAAASLTDLLHGRPPAEIILLAQFFIGLTVGVNYVGVTAEELKRIVLAALGFCGLLAMLSVCFGQFAALIGAAPAIEAMLAFAPGGQAEMVVLAIVAGADIAYVVTLHLTRLIVVILGAPILARLSRASGADQ
ncbi:MAG: AbrB family transcriptional regulator [Neomegalonema sp.]|nr:AbrB family transcriptional regulator [Neomegalonema sp.]